MVAAPTKPMIDKSTLLTYYKRKDIQEALIYSAKGKEVAVRFNDFFGKRPDTLQYPNDVLEFAKKGATSFHVSEEIWDNPYNLTSSSTKKDLDELRVGWDLVIDIDCAIIDYSKISAHYVINALKKEGVKNISVKFSGNKGFHIGVPYESFPKKVSGEDVSRLFPEAPRKIAEYLKHQIKKPVAKRLLEMDDFGSIIEKTGMKKEDIIYTERNEFGDSVERLDVEPFLNIDTILISPRHLFRMPYSLHEKSGLASVPIDPKDLLSFTRESADPRKVTVGDVIFLEREKSAEGEAAKLFLNSFDFVGKKEVFKTKREDLEKTAKEFSEKDFDDIQNEVSEEFFPQCIRQILGGLKDGRKRAVLILINFFSSVGWSHERIEEKLREWNEKNPEPLKENYFLGQLRYHKQQKKKVLPPNCDNNMYYRDLGVKCEDCRVKNPVSYVRKQLWILNRKAEEKEREEAAKEARKEGRKRKKEEGAEKVKTD